MTLPSTNSNTTYPCNECPAGVLHRTAVTYFTWIGDELITVPDFPAWVCDVCGRREYDMHALARLSLMLTPNTGKGNRPPRAHPRKKSSPKPPQPSTNE